SSPRPERASLRAREAVSSGSGPMEKVGMDSPSPRLNIRDADSARVRRVLGTGRGSVPGDARRTGGRPEKRRGARLFCGRSPARKWQYAGWGSALRPPVETAMKTTTRCLFRWIATAALAVAASGTVPYAASGDVPSTYADRGSYADQGSSADQGTYADPGSDVPDPGTAGRIRWLGGPVDIDQGDNSGAGEATVNSPVFEGDFITTL